MTCSSNTANGGAAGASSSYSSLLTRTGVILLALALTFDAAGYTASAASLSNYPPNAFKYHRRASMPSLSVVSPLDVLRETQTHRLLADRINANNAYLSRIGKRANEAPSLGFLQILEELSQAEEP